MQSQINQLIEEVWKAAYGLWWISELPKSDSWKPLWFLREYTNYVNIQDWTFRTSTCWEHYPPQDQSCDRWSRQCFLVVSRIIFHVMVIRCAGRIRGSLEVSYCTRRPVRRVERSQSESLFNNAAVSTTEDASWVIFGGKYTWNLYVEQGQFSLSANWLVCIFTHIDTTKHPRHHWCICYQYIDWSTSEAHHLYMRMVGCYIPTRSEHM